MDEVLEQLVYDSVKSYLEKNGRDAAPLFVLRSTKGWGRVGEKLQVVEKLLYQFESRDRRGKRKALDISVYVLGEWLLQLTSPPPLSAQVLFQNLHNIPKAFEWYFPGYGESKLFPVLLKANRCN